ncbi:MAG: single-stranded DNA-binding protein [Hymenobacteraceae bacterium]|nr:single-stranded DNA-binding protein [Hymenobacteraceae bacterium]
MQGVNKVILIGNLGKDPEIRHLEGGRSKAGFTLATTETYRDKDGGRGEHTEWHNVVSWIDGLNTGVIMKYLHKGSPVYVEGQIRSRQYQDKENVTRYVTEIHIDQLTLLGSKPAGAPDDRESALAESPRTYAQETEPDALPF